MAPAMPEHAQVKSEWTRAAFVSFFMVHMQVHPTTSSMMCVQSRPCIFDQDGTTHSFKLTLLCVQAAAVLLQDKHLLCQYEVGLHTSLYDVCQETMLHFAAALETLIADAHENGVSGHERALLDLVSHMSAVRTGLQLDCPLQGAVAEWPC